MGATAPASCLIRKSYLRIHSKSKHLPSSSYIKNMAEVTRRRCSKAKRSDASYKLKNELKSLISRVARLQTWTWPGFDRGEVASITISKIEMKKIYRREQVEVRAGQLQNKIGVPASIFSPGWLQTKKKRPTSNWSGVAGDGSRRLELCLSMQS